MQLMKEIAAASRALRTIFKPTKLNIGIIGNYVRHGSCVSSSSLASCLLSLASHLLTHPAQHQGSGGALCAWSIPPLLLLISRLFMGT